MENGAREEEERCGAVVVVVVVESTLMLEHVRASCMFAKRTSHATTPDTFIGRNVASV